MVCIRGAHGGGREREPPRGFGIAAPSGAGCPDSALLRQALGETMAALGESDAAIGWWNGAAARAPSGATAAVHGACSHADPGSEELALAAAQSAYLRAPRDLETIATLAMAFAKSGAGMDPRKQEALLRSLDEFQSASPSQIDVFVPIQVGLLLQPIAPRLSAESGLNSPPQSRERGDADPSAQAAAEAGLPIANDLLEFSESIHGVTPQLALARAVEVQRSGGVDAGLKTFDGLRSRAAIATTSIQWDLARASYLGSNGRPDAGPAWLALSAANPDSLDAQLGALASDAPGRIWTVSRPSSSDSAHSQVT